MLLRNCRLTRLNLRIEIFVKIEEYNEIDDEGIKALAAGLAANSTLVMLNIGTIRAR